MIQKKQFQSLSYEQQYKLLEKTFDSIGEDAGILFSAKQLFEISEKPSEKVLGICFGFLVGIYELAKGDQHDSYTQRQQEALTAIQQLEKAEEELNLDDMLHSV